MPEVQENLNIPNKAKWNCEITTKPKDDKGFTVGEVFTLGCEGAPLTLKEPLKVELSEMSHHVLVLLKPLEMTESKISYQATSYRAGTFKMPFLDISDAAGGGFISQPMEIKTISVIDQKKPPESPYGPISPFKMVWPPWLFFSVVVFALVLVAWLVIFFRRRVQRKNLEKNIKKFQSPMGSYHQFSKDIRLLKRSVVFSRHVEWQDNQKSEYLVKLEDAYRMFVLREFVVPADRWPIKMILKHMKRKDRVSYNSYSDLVIKAFRELERTKGQVEKISSSDCEQITSICSQAVDAMWKNKKAHGGAR